MSVPRPLLARRYLSTLRVLLGISVLLLLAGCASSAVSPPQAGALAKTVYVLGHGWHTGIVIKRADIPQGLWPEQHDFPTATYLEVGWGDKDFYRSPRPTLALALRAAFHSSGSVLHVVGFVPPPEQYFPKSDVIAIHLSPQGLESLVRFIHQSYQRNGADKAQPLGPGWYANSRFYLATGKYHLFNTCNNWVARALRAAGCVIHPATAMTAGNLIAQAQRCGRIVQRRTIPSHEESIPLE